MGTYRLVVCIDVEADSLKNAYGKTWKGMAESELDWESSDEWFDPDGGHGNPDTLQVARMEYCQGTSVVEALTKDPQAPARKKASEELEHAAIGLGETVCATEREDGEIRRATNNLEKAAIDYHIACIDTGGE